MAEQALAPRLTNWDGRVMAALPPGRGKRLADVARELRILPPLYWAEDSEVAVAHNRRARVAYERRLEELRLTLRGLEHMGHCTGRGGWWRRG